MKKKNISKCSFLGVIGLSSIAVISSMGCGPKKEVTYTIGGTVTGLPEFKSVTLVLNDSEQELPHFFEDGPTFEFANGVVVDTAYVVTAINPPSFYTCEVSGGEDGNGGGTLTANVDDIAVDCEPLTIVKALESVPDAELKACINAAADNLNNLWIMAYEVESLNCDTFSLTDVDGLGQFTNLTNFSTFNNPEVLTLDQELANLTNLTTLTLQLSGLKTISLSENTALLYLTLYANELTEINFDNNVLLVDVNLSVNCWNLDMHDPDNLDGYLDLWAPSGTYSVSNWPDAHPQNPCIVTP